MAPSIVNLPFTLDFIVWKWIISQATAGSVKVYTQFHYCKGFSTEMTKAGIREFRSDQAEYIASNTPEIVTRHGQTVD